VHGACYRKVWRSDLIPFLASFVLRRAPVNGVWIEGPADLISFLKPVAASASRRGHQPPFTLGGVTGPPEMAVYSLAGNATSPFHAEPAHSSKPSHPRYSVDFSLIPSLSGRKLFIEGATDLPDGARIAYEVEHEDWKKVDPRIRSAVALTFANGSIPVEHGRYSKMVDLSGWRAGSVSVWAAFEPVIREQPDTVRQKYGKQGEFLIGPNVTTTNIKDIGSYSRVELTRKFRLAK
jgi:hypothetical protein